MIRHIAVAAAAEIAAPKIRDGLPYNNARSEIFP